jgi:transcriptional regulator with PAS, ATPase and Fis domain
MIEIFRQIINIAKYDYPAHIFGETGTGKELVAEAIHKASFRKDGPFVPINCGAIPEGLVESELFGHVKGSFSGAIRDKKGRLELADGGTIFLDEIAELSKHMQAKLLRFLQDAIQFAFVKSRGGNITPDTLPMEINDDRLFQTIRGPSRKLDRAQVESAIKKTGGNKAKAARLLHVGRATLYRFLNDYKGL